MALMTYGNVKIMGRGEPCLEGRAGSGLEHGKNLSCWNRDFGKCFCFNELIGRKSKEVRLESRWQK